METRYSLNEETLKFVIEFERHIQSGEVQTNRELVKRFGSSPFNKEQFGAYYPTAISKAIWWAIKRSGKWSFVKRGTYMYRDSSDTNQLNFPMTSRRI